MIIVSQDKDIILNFENIDVILVGNPLDTDNGEFQIIANTISDNEVRLGCYKTEERAKEVLKEILKAKATFELFRTAPAGGKIQADYLIRLTNKKIILDTYEMPEE